MVASFLPSDALSSYIEINACDEQAYCVLSTGLVIVAYLSHSSLQVRALFKFIAGLLYMSSTRVCNNIKSY